MKTLRLVLGVLCACIGAFRLCAYGEESSSYDVCVVGGGVSGVCAALQAARAGAKTVLVEQGFQVVGEAAAYAVKEGKDLWNGLSAIDLTDLRTRLRASGAIVPDAPSNGMALIIAATPQAR